MTSYPKKSVKLTGAAYHKFRVGIIERDGCQCRNPLCGLMDLDPPYQKLSVEHKVPRSTLRLDTPENGVTLCVKCNGLVADGLLYIDWDGNVAHGVWVKKGSLKEWERKY